jgi:hypothetical protein
MPNYRIQAAAGSRDSLLIILVLLLLFRRSWPSLFLQVDQEFGEGCLLIPFEALEVCLGQLIIGLVTKISKGIMLT